MWAELKRLHQELRGTFLYVTHDQAEAMTLSDPVVVMSRGKVEQVGRPRDIYAEPATLFVATFFGSPRINVLRPETVGLPPDPGVQLAIRPEHVHLRQGTPPPGALPGFRLYLVEPTGAESWVTVERDGERLTARAPGDFQAARDEALWVRVEPERLQSFDAQTGERRTRAG